MVARYRRVSQGEEVTEEDEQKKERAERIEKITSKIHALIWVGLSVAIMVYTNIIKLAFTDDRINRWVIWFLFI